VRTSHSQTKSSSYTIAEKNTKNQAQSNIKSKKEKERRVDTFFNICMEEQLKLVSISLEMG
jgi:hypothetical protein